MTRAARRALTDLRLVPLREQHLRQVLKIEALVYPRPWTPGVFRSELAQPDNRRYYVALAPPSTRFARRGVVGYGGVLLQADEAHITTLAVHPAQHRRKIASHLLLRLLRDAIAMGAQAATLEVRNLNAGAQRLYQEFGFAPVGVRPGYYAETHEDALIMWVHDLPGEAMRALLDTQERRLTLPGGSSGAEDLPVPWVQGRTGLDGDR